MTILLLFCGRNGWLRRSHTNQHTPELMTILIKLLFKTRAMSAPMPKSPHHCYPLEVCNSTCLHCFGFTTQIDYIGEKKIDADSSGKTEIDVSISVVFDSESNSAGLLKHETLYPALPHFSFSPFNMHI